MHKYKSSIGRKYVWNYRAAVFMLGYLQVSTQPEISMVVNQCAQFFNNPRIVNKHSFRRIAKYVVSTFTYMDLPDRNKWLSTYRVVYKPDKEKSIRFYTDAKLADRWAQADVNNAENSMPHTVYVITYAGCPVLWFSKLQTEII